MKVFASSQTPSVILIICLSLVLGGAVLDKIPRHDNYRAHFQKCDNITPLFNKNVPNCTAYSVTLHSYGWPFVAIRKPAAGQEAKYQYVHSLKLDSENTVLLSLNSVLVLAAGLGSYLVYSRYLSNRLFGSNTDSPVIAPSDMLEGGSLNSMAKGIVASYTYNLLTNPSGRVMLVISLNKDTGMHVVATGSRSQGSLAFSQRINSRFLKPIELEGNYPQYFEVYCTDGKEIELLQIFNPSIMDLLANFCIAYQFELFKDTLYISQANDASDQTDTTTMVGDAEILLTKLGSTIASLN